MDACSHFLFPFCLIGQIKYIIFMIKYFICLNIVVAMI